MRSLAIVAENRSEKPRLRGRPLAKPGRAVPGGVDAVLDGSGRGEIPLSIELAGGPERVLTLVAFDAADKGIRIHVDGPGANLVRALKAILGLIEDGRLQVPISRTYPDRGSCRAGRQSDRACERQARASALAQP